MKNYTKLWQRTFHIYLLQFNYILVDDKTEEHTYIKIKSQIYEAGVKSVWLKNYIFKMPQKLCLQKF